jgi:hypothetical protein
MATRVNFNVFRYGKTIKWNFSAPSTNFNKLIRASYVFNKWCPIILKHFNITALHFTFRIESLGGQIIFIGYRRIARQQTLDHDMPGSALHSKSTHIGRFSLPWSIRINDFPVFFNYVMYHHVPFSRLLIPFSTPYHLSSKALEENYDHHFAPIISSSSLDNLAQFTFLKYLEEIKKFNSPAYLVDFTKVNKEKRWRIRKKMKIKLSGVFRQAGLGSDAALSGVFKKLLSERRRPRPKDNRIRVFGRKHRPADILMFMLCSLNRVKNRLLKQRAHLTHCKAAIRQFRRLRASYRAAKGRILDVGYYSHAREKNEDDDDGEDTDEDIDEKTASKLSREAFIKSVKLMNSLYSLAGKRIKRLKALKRRILKYIATMRKMIKRFKKRLPYLKKSVRALSNYYFTAGLLSKAPSAMNVTNMFSHEGFFAALKGKRQEFMPFDRKLARKLVPEMMSNLQFKRRFKKVSKFYLKVAFSKKGKSNIFSISANKKKLRTLSSLRLISYLYSATKDITLYEASGAINLSIFRKRGHPFIYNYSLSRPSRPFKKVIFALKKFYERISFYSIDDHKFYNSLRPRHLRRYPAVIAELKQFRIFDLLRVRVLSLLSSLTVRAVFSTFSGNLNSNLFNILRSEKHIYNLFIDVVGLVNKFSRPRRLALGEVYSAPYHLRKFPVEHEVRPFSFPSLGRKEPNWSFFEFKNAVRCFYNLFSIEHYMHCVPFLRLSFSYDIKDLFLGAYPHCDWGRTITLLQKSFLTVNSALTQPTALEIKEEMFDSYPVAPYIDDVKEALSIDFLPEADAEKIQLDDGEYKRALLFSNPTVFLREFQSSLNEVDPFNLKELRFINSLIIGAIDNLDNSSNADDYAYLQTGDGGRIYSSTPYEFQLIFDRVRKISSVLKPLFRALDKTYPRDQWSAEVDSAPGWPIFNRVISTLIPIYNGIKLITKLCRLPSENINNFFINPLSGDHYWFYNRVFNSYHVFNYSKNFLVSSKLFNSKYVYFFNYYFSQCTKTTINWAYYHCPSDFTIHHNLGNLYYYNILFQRSAKEQVFFNTLRVDEHYFSTPIVIGGINAGFNRLNMTRPAVFNRLVGIFTFPKLIWNTREAFVSYLKIRMYYYFILSSHRFVLNFIGDKRAAPEPLFLNTYKFFNDWIYTVADEKVKFTDSSLNIFDANHKYYILKDIHCSSSQLLFFKYFFSNIFKKKNKKIYIRSILFYSIYLLMHNSTKFYVNFIVKLVFDLLRVKISTGISDKAHWLTQTSAPYSDSYLTSHGDLLNDLTRAFYNIFAMPIFVKYFPLPVFFASSPELSKFASGALENVAAYGKKMDANTRDWYLEYLFVAYASLSTKSAEGIVNFIIRILPYYRKWGDPVALILSPIAAADLNSMGIDTVKLSFRGRPGGVERARTTTYIYGSVTNPAMRKLYTAGSYCYKQCISHTNGGVTSVHLWIISRI